MQTQQDQTHSLPQPQPQPQLNSTPVSNRKTLAQAAVNTTSFKNIVLTHGVPSTFVKNEIFPFRGYITVPNPAGVKVNVIFTRVSDQKRLAFSSYLPAGTVNFEILVSLTLSGNYYLSVFSGLQGSTSLSQYTVIPNFYGQTNAKPPVPLAEAALVLKDNDLWVTWNSTDPLPVLTQLIFSQ